MVVPQCGRCGGADGPHYCLRDQPHAWVDYDHPPRKRTPNKCLKCGENMTLQHYCHYLKASEAVVILNAIKVLCDEIVAFDSKSHDYYLAEEILRMIKGNDEEPHL